MKSQPRYPLVGRLRGASIEPPKRGLHDVGVQAKTIRMQNLPRLSSTSRFLTALRSGRRSRKLLFVNCVASRPRLGVDLPEVSGDCREILRRQRHQAGRVSAQESFPAPRPAKDHLGELGAVAAPPIG